MSIVTSLLYVVSMTIARAATQSVIFIILSHVHAQYDSAFSGVGTISS